MKIRKATKKDKKNFIEVQKEAFPNLNSKKQSKYFDEKLNKKEIFVVGDKEYAGHVCFGNHKLSPPFSGGVFIEELAIKKKLRGQGIGTSLINYLINYCKKSKIGMIYLSTGDYKKNKSIDYYKKLGFVKIGVLKEINPHSEYSYGQIIMGNKLK